jgi:hypothetical protein
MAISDEALKRATGKDRKAWFSILDKAGGKAMGHTKLARFVFDKYLGKKGANTNVATSGGWWSQMVTVEYERARGLRAVNQNADGFLVAMHKTFPFTREEFLKKWTKLPSVKKLTPTPTRSKRPMLRYKAKDGIVVVTMDDRPGRRVRVMVEAARMKSKASVERERAFWRKQLEAMAD